MEWIEKRVRDGSILRLIGKWIHAGDLEDGRRDETIERDLRVRGVVRQQQPVAPGESHGPLERRQVRHCRGGVGRIVEPEH